MQFFPILDRISIFTAITYVLKAAAETTPKPWEMEVLCACAASSRLEDDLHEVEAVMFRKWKLS